MGHIGNQVPPLFLCVLQTPCMVLKDPTRSASSVGPVVATLWDRSPPPNRRAELPRACMGESNRRDTNETISTPTTPDASPAHKR